MTRDEMFNLINKDRKENFKDISKSIGNNVIERFVNDNLNTKNLDKNFEKNIKCAIGILSHINEAKNIQDQGDILYLSIIHLLDSFCMLEEKRIINERDNFSKLFKNLMGGFKL